MDGLLRRVLGSDIDTSSTLQGVAGEMQYYEELMAKGATGWMEPAYNTNYQPSSDEDIDIAAWLASAADPLSYTPESPRLPLAISLSDEPEFVALDELQTNGDTPTGFEIRRDDQPSLTLSNDLPPNFDANAFLDSLNNLPDVNTATEGLPDFAVRIAGLADSIRAPPPSVFSGSKRKRVDDDAVSAYNGSQLGSVAASSQDDDIELILKAYDAVPGHTRRQRTAAKLTDRLGITIPTVSERHEKQFEQGRRNRIFNLSDIPVHRWPSRANVLRRMNQRYSQLTSDAQRALQYAPEEFNSFYSYFRPISRHALAPFSAKDKKLSEKDFARPSPSFQAYCEANPIPNFNPTDYCFMNASSLVAHKHLQRFSRKCWKEIPQQHSELHSLAASYMSDLFSPFKGKIPCPTKSDLEKVPYDGSRHPGFIYASAPFHLRSRKEAYPFAIRDATSRWEQLERGLVLEQRPFMLGGRGKMVPMSMARAIEENVEKGRMILMADSADHLLLGAWLQPITEQVISQIDEFSIGKTFVHQGAELDYENSKDAMEWICNDAVKFDSSIEPPMARLAINSLLSVYDWQTSTISRPHVEDFIYTTLIETVIAFKEGYLMQKFCGTASGHNWNSGVQSWITIYAGVVYVGSRLKAKMLSVVKESSSIRGMGDDNRILKFNRSPAGVNPWNDLSHTDAIEIVREATNVNWVSPKSKIGKYVNMFGHARAMIEPSKYDSTMEYLSRYLAIADYAPYGDGPMVVSIRNPMDNLLALYYPEKKGNERYFARAEGEDECLAYQYARACGHLVDNGGHRLFREYVDGYLNYLEGRGVNPHHIPVTEQFIKRAERLDYGDQFKALVLKRSTEAQWLSLMTTPRSAAPVLDAWQQARIDMGLAPQGKKRKTQPEAALKKGLGRMGGTVDIMKRVLAGGVNQFLEKESDPSVFMDALGLDSAPPPTTLPSSALSKGKATDPKEKPTARDYLEGRLPVPETWSPLLGISAAAHAEILNKQQSTSKFTRVESYNRWLFSQD